MTRRAALMFVACLSVVLLSLGCGRSSPVGAKPPADQDVLESDLTNSDQLSDADKAWDEILAGYSITATPDGADEFVHYMMGVQQSLHWIRKRGLEFWQNFPSDPRRYYWLVNTVNVPPTYVQSLESWAQNERKLGPNTAAPDVEAIARWESVYTELRQEFWHSDSVDDQLRRYLWAGELEQKLKRLREAKARGDRIPEFAELHSELLSFVEAYPSHFSDVEYQTYLWSLARSLNYVGLSELFALEDNELLAFADDLRRTETVSGLLFYESYQARPRRIDWWWPKADADLVDYFGSRTKWSWQWIDEEPPEGRVLSAIRLSVFNYPSFVQATQVYHRVPFQYDRIVGTLKYRILGLQFWDHLTQDERAEWAADQCTMHGAPRLVADFNWSVFSGDRGWPRGEFATLDHEYHQRIETLLQDEASSVRQRATALSGRLNCKKTRIIWDGRGYDRKDFQALVSEFHQAFEKFAGQPKIDSSMYGLLLSVTKPMYRNRWELSDTDLASIAAPFLLAADDVLRNAAVAVSDRVDLEQGVPVAVQAPTLDGAPFDTRDLLGKIVLVDHWDTNCAPCISAMPALHDTYLDYKDRGFEVVSIAYDGASRRRIVERYKSEMGLTWTTLNGEGLWGAVAAKYGLDGFPSYMLLNRDGEFVAGNDELRDVSNLPRILEEIFAAEASKIEATTVN